MPADLSTSTGRDAVEAAISALRAGTETDPVRRAAQLRTRFDPDTAMAALAQAELRDRATEKFGAGAERMYFTRAGLEQASRIEVASHRAERFAASGAREVLDLCSGIGADALAFSRAGLQVTAVEQDHTTATILAANLAGLRALIQIGSAQDSSWRNAASVFLDPARRDSQRRIFDPDAYSPSIGFALDVLATARLAAVKLAPGLPHALIPPDVEAEWVSYRGGVKEAVLWSPSFAAIAPSPARRRATVLGRSGVTSGSGTAKAGIEHVRIEELSDTAAATEAIGAIGAYLYEPDGAVIRAGLVQQCAALLPGGRRIDEHLAYLSADAPQATALADGYRVLDVLPYSVKRLRSELRRREVGIVEIKKRGVDVDPAALRKQLKPAGENSITVLLARVGQQHLAILAVPI